MTLPKAIADLMARARMSRETPLAAASAPPAGDRIVGDHPVANLRRLADEWRGSDRNAVEVERAPLSDEIPTPAAMSAAADDLALDVTPCSRSIQSLKARDLPCVVLLKTGGSVLVKREGPADDEFVCDLAGRTRIVAKAELAAEHSGTVFLVRPKETDTRETSEERSGVPVKSPSLLRRIFEMTLAEQRPLILRLLLAAGISNLLMMTLPMFTMAVYDRVVPHLAMETLWALTIGITIALCVDLAVRYVRLRLVDAVGLTVSTGLQASLYRRLMGLPLSDAPRTSGAIANQMRDIDAICQAVPQVMVALAVDLPFLVLVLAMMIAIGGPVVLAPLIGLAVLAVVYGVVHVKGRAHVMRAAELSQIQSNQLIETVAALPTVKTTSAEQRLLQRWETICDESAYASHRNRTWSGFAGQASYIISQAIVVGVVVISVYRIADGLMSVGALAACTLLVGRGVTPLVQLVALADKVTHLARAAELVDRLLTARLETGGDSARGDARAIKGDIAISNVSFAYPGEANPALSNISLTIRPGEKVGVIGRVGSGKSTLLQMLVRLVEPTSGNISIDGADIRQFAPQALRQAVGLLQQDAALFDDTLRANIGFGLASATQAAFDMATRISGIKEFADRHPRGYDMRVGPRGERLSGGERQAVALARVLLGQPQVLILDEPTASMDNTSEARLIRDLKVHLADRTLIVSTHRAAVLSLVDRIVWIEGGKVVADGPRAEVMARLTGGAQKSA
ncbi:MAG: ATP-binding cassette domain-containing protein [Hyphomicrobiaceae bacterium]|nr:ATP-binding cassette domain-containing protein [Hyphomicrobiaceae bacterium]